MYTNKNTKAKILSPLFISEIASHALEENLIIQTFIIKCIGITIGTVNKIKKSVSKLITNNNNKNKHVFSVYWEYMFLSVRLADFCIKINIFPLYNFNPKDYYFPATHLK